MPPAWGRICFQCSDCLRGMCLEQTYVCKLLAQQLGYCPVFLSKHVLHWKTCLGKKTGTRRTTLGGGDLSFNYRVVLECRICCTSPVGTHMWCNQPQLLAWVMSPLFWTDSVQKSGLITQRSCGCLHHIREWTFAAACVPWLKKNWTWLRNDAGVMYQGWMDYQLCACPDAAVSGLF